MKKIPVVSGLAAAAAGIAVALLVLLTPSKSMECFEVSGDGTAYAVSTYGWGKLLHIIGSDGSSKSVLLDGINSETQYFDMLSVNDNVYLLGLDSSVCFVSVYDKTGKRFKDAFHMDTSNFEVDEVFISPNIIVDSETHYIETHINVVIIEDSAVYTYDIEAEKDPSGERHYNLGANAQAIWAALDNDELYFMNSDGEIFYVPRDKPAHRFDIGNDIVPFEPFVFSGALYFTDIRTGNLLSCRMGENDEFDSVSDVKFNDLTGIKDRYDLSQARHIKAGGGRFERGEYGSFVGVIKESGERGKIVTLGAPQRKAIDEPAPAFSIAALASLICAAAVFLVLCAALGLIRFALAVRKLAAKQIVVSLLVILASFLPVWIAVRTIIQDIVDQQLIGASIDFTTYVEYGVDKEHFAQSGLTDHERASMKKFENQKVAGIIAWTDIYFNILDRGKMYLVVGYIDVARLVDGEYYYEYYTDQKPGAKVSYFYSEEVLDEIKSTDCSQVILSRSKSYNSDWVEIIKPFADENGTPIGFIQTGYNYEDLKRRVNINSLLITVWVMLLLVTVSFILLLSILRLLKPMKKIRRAVTEISEGKIGATVSVKSNDELQDIAYSFSEMSRKLEKYFDSINVISKAYERFLPKDFFRLMGKKNVLDVKPSDSSEITLTYLFVGIDLYNTHKNGGDSFKMINRIFSASSDAVISRGGAIQNLSDRCLTAIFSTLPADATEAGLAMLEKIRALPDEDAEITVTVQRAASTIGVIGTESAMNNIVVSSAVDLQQYINEAMRQFNLEFVITENAKKELSGLNITLRFIGNLSELCPVYSGRYDVLLYEVLDGCCDSVKTLKMSTLSSFDSGMDALQKEDYTELRRRMIDVLRINRSDLVAEYYLLKADEKIHESEEPDEGKHRLEIPYKV